MPLYRRDVSGTFIPFEVTAFPDLERVLEDWIEHNPHLLLEGEDLAIIARQPRTTFGKFLDLLAVDASGACVIVELKRGEAPREVIAQALEYAAWVDSLTVDQLDGFAHAYAASHGLDAAGVAVLYARTFAPEPEDTDANGDELAGRVTFNNRQRLVIVAEHFSGEVEQVLRYLRTRGGLDITGVQFAVHRTAEETIIQTEVIVGRERAAPRPPSGGRAAETEAHDAIIARLPTDALRAAVDGLEDWLAERRDVSVEVRHGTLSDHTVLVHGRRVARYYFAERWLFCALLRSTPEEAALLRGRLSKPHEVKEIGARVRFHVVVDADLEVLKERLLVRIHAPPRS